TEALQLMPQGAKYRLYIPQNLAYGAQPHPGGPIEPYMALVFDVELLEIA
ncbi:MAG: FKBP-type peptidyl-prolyl cis-trans isomerase, partial [Crocinitomicaceae bacterium]